MMGVAFWWQPQSVLMLKEKGHRKETLKPVISFCGEIREDLVRALQNRTLAAASVLILLPTVTGPHQDPLVTLISF